MTLNQQRELGTEEVDAVGEDKTWAPGDIELDLRYQTALEATGLCDPMKYFEWAGMPRVAPRDPDGSGMLARFVREDSLRMPSLATSVVDASGVALLRGWIAQLSACP